MKTLPLLLFVITPFCLHAQEKGIHFEHSLTWTEIKQKAKAENKFIFMDCFTTWCGPCRFMSEKIFPAEETGRFVNDKFISVKVQLDTTAGDDSEVKSWYADAGSIAKVYSIRTYPTYLIFDADGNAVHRFSGASNSPAEFVERVKQSLDPENQYYSLLKQYKNGRKDSAFLHKLTILALGVYDDSMASIANEYLNTQSNLFTKDNLTLIVTITRSSKGRGFETLLNYPSKADSILGDRVAENIVQQIIMQEEVFANLHQGDAEPDWISIEATLTKKYPVQAPEITAMAKVAYCYNTAAWDKFQFAIADYMKKYGAKISPDALNMYAWTVFQNCNDLKCLEQALEWSRNSFKNNNEPAYMDTYANILYKLGKKEEAMNWEQKALELAPADDKKVYEETLQKMKTGEKSWN